MTEQQLLHTLRNVDSKYAAEANERAAQAVAAKQHRRRKLPVMLASASAAACLGLAVIAFLPKDQKDMMIANSERDEQLAVVNSTQEQETEPAYSVTETTAAPTAAKTQNGTTTAKNAKTSQTTTARNNGKAATTTTTRSTVKDQQPVVIPLGQTNGYVTMPDFTHMKFEDAEKLAQSLGISLNKIQRVHPMETDTVIDQYTFAGNKVQVGMEYDVEVSTGGNVVTLRFEIPAEYQDCEEPFQIILVEPDNKLYDLHRWGDLIDPNPKNMFMHGHFGYHLCPALCPAGMSSPVEELGLVGTGTVDVTAIMLHGNWVRFSDTDTLDPNVDYAVLGKYHIDYDKETVTTLSEDIAGAFRYCLQQQRTDLAGCYEIPNFVGMTWGQAQIAAEQTPIITVDAVEIYSSMPRGTVLWQSAEAGDLVDASSRQDITLHISSGGRKQISFSLLQPDSEKNELLFDGCVSFDGLSPLDDITFYLYRLDQDGNRISSEAEVADAKYNYNVQFWGAGTADFEGVIQNGYGDEAVVGTYRINFDNMSYKLISGDVMAALEQFTVKTPDFTNMTLSEARVLAKKFGMWDFSINWVESDQPAGTVLSQLFPAGMPITPRRCVIITVAGHAEKPVSLSFELKVPSGYGYTGTYYFTGCGEEYDTPGSGMSAACVKFQPLSTHSKVIMNVQGYGSGNFKLIVSKDGSDQTAVAGVYHLDFENQTAETISSDFDAAFKALNAN